MSNIYIQEPSTEGKVLMVTSAGDFDIELWSREAPKACRNFVQLCLESYYNGTIFHRVIPGFIVQGGDPTGTGEGGESIYGKPFRDEFHSRLRFVRRGLVAMANAGPHDNGSQFFFTLGQCPELQNKHTVFGKVTGNTLYNLPRFEEGIIGKDDRPEYPHKVIKTEVLNNPFPDIVPRLAIENEIPKEERKKKKKGTKNFKLLSFGDEAEEEEEEVLAATKNFTTKGNSAHDIAMDPTLSASTGTSKGNVNSEMLEKIKKKLRKEEPQDVIKNEVLEPQKVEEESIPEPEDKFREEEETISEEKARKMAEMQAEIKKLKQEITGKVPKERKEISEEEEEEKESDTLKEYKMEKAKYEEEKKKLPRKGASREKQTLALLERFSAKVQKAFNEAESDEETPVAEEGDDNDDTWLRHKFHFNDSNPVLAKDASTKGDSWYEMDDPRNPINKRRRDETNKAQKKTRK
ncbi:spliceosome-associated protein CWC27 homolog [Penaeus chinensis]|uniref:spliceosome-associated protein CWC27 homolog n=1 Tax=Penaeus chinensis TaxID=139456 RepID=UPI001FB70C37|nr:spliceosome-associated protein CWC27 homolog [Penaeus chinensis]